MRATLLEMERADSSSLKIVTDEESARLLSDPKQARLLLPFLGRERTLTEAAEELGLRLDAMYYRVKRLERPGLVRVVRLLERKGRAIRTYQASASAYFVPLTAVPDATVEQLLEQGDAGPRKRVTEGLAAALKDATLTIQFGIHVRLDPSGEPSIGLGPQDADWQPQHLLDAAAPALLTSWVSLQLDFADAKALQRELFDLIARYAALGGAQSYLMGVSLVPTPAPGGHDS